MNAAAFTFLELGMARSFAAALLALVCIHFFRVTPEALGTVAAVNTAPVITQGANCAGMSCPAFGVTENSPAPLGVGAPASVPPVVLYKPMMTHAARSACNRAAMAVSAAHHQETRRV